MEIYLNVFTVVSVLTIATSIMLGLLFITSPSNNKKANLFLGLSLWSLAFEVFRAISDAFSGDIRYIPYTSLFTIPFLLFYSNQTINNKIKPWYYLLYLPGVMINMFGMNQGDGESFKYFEYVFNIIILIYILIIIKKHNKQVNNFYSDVEHKTLQWIKIIVFIYLGFHALWIIEDVVRLQNENLIEYFVEISNVLTLFMVYWIGYNGFSQHETFKQRFSNTFSEENNDVIIPNETISAEDQTSFDRIKSLILKERLYTNPKINLRTLSEAVEMNPKEVSRLINQFTEANFYHFINRFRIDEFKLLLDSPRSQQLSILGLAEEVGFNSKSTFYTAFKACEGITPKAYQSKIKRSE